MYDAFLAYSTKINLQNLEVCLLDGQPAGIPEKYYYLTCHREENTDDNALLEILKAMELLELQTVYPVHPRNRERVLRLKRQHTFQNIIFVEPVGYLESICLIQNAKKIVTDSGGTERSLFCGEEVCDGIRFCLLARDDGWVPE